MFPGFVLIKYGMTADTEMTVMREEVYTHSSLKAEGMACRALWRRAREGQEAERGVCDPETKNQLRVFVGRNG